MWITRNKLRDNNDKKINCALFTIIRIINISENKVDIALKKVIIKINRKERKRILRIIKNYKNNKKRIINDNRIVIKI